MDFKKVIFKDGNVEAAASENNQHIYQKYNWSNFDELLKRMACNGLGIHNKSRIL